tara:strand:+ start:62 stop:373 length:312 start_codon:yes stop_codon:yes gene_type:complete
VFRRWVQRRDGVSDLCFLGNKDSRATGLLVDIKPGLAENTLVCILPNGQVTYGAQAVFSVVSQTDGMIGFFASLLRNRFVSWLFEPGYKLFARHRGRFAWLFR